MNCGYCMTPETPFQKANNGFTWNKKKVHSMNYSEGFQIKKNIDKVLDNYFGLFDAPILKISGGEILLLKNLIQLIKRESPRYETVQILTNGTLISESFLDQLGEISNVTFQLSLDGHLLDMNGYRARAEKMQTKILQNLELMVKKGFEVEINCVVHRRNSMNLNLFAEYLIDKYSDKVILMPFPVRHNSKQFYGADPSQLKGIELLIENYHDYKAIIPPKKYLGDMYEFISNKSLNTIRCFTPYFVLQSFETGISTPCPLSWGENIGNIVTDKDGIEDNYGNSASYDLRTLDPPRLINCKNCFTDIYVYSLYFNHLISLEEIIHCRPLLKRPKAKARILELYKIFSDFVINTKVL